MTDLLTTQEAADLLRLKKTTLEIWRVQGRGPVFVKLGARVLYERSALEEYATASRKRSTSGPGIGVIPPSQSTR